MTCTGRTDGTNLAARTAFDSEVGLDSFRWSAKQVALIPRCVECDAFWLPADGERWQAWLTDDEPPKLAFYGPKCADREFSSE